MLSSYIPLTRKNVTSAMNRWSALRHNMR